MIALETRVKIAHAHRKRFGGDDVDCVGGDLPPAAAPYFFFPNSGPRYAFCSFRTIGLILQIACFTYGSDLYAVASISERSSKARAQNGDQ